MTNKLKGFIYLFYLLVVFSLSVSPSFAEGDVLILSPDNPKARAIADKIKSKLGHHNVIITENPNEIKNPQLVITLGSKQLRANATNINAPTLASFVSPSEFAAANKGGGYQAKPVYSVVSPQSLMQYIKETFGNVRVGYIYTDKDDGYLSEMKIFSHGNGPQVVPVELKKDIFKTLRRMISRRTVDIMIISNDTRVFNRKNIRFVLEALYREKIPTIGFSKNLVDAGAVAAVFSDEDALVEQTIAAANKYLLTGDFSNGMYASISDVVYKRAFIDEFNISPKGNYTLQ